MNKPTDMGPPLTSEEAAPEEPPKSLTDRLLDNQRARWERGERAPVEAYLDKHPELTADTETVLDLIYQEIFLRNQLGEEPRLPEYQERFPALAAPLHDLFEVDGAVDAGPLLDAAATEDVPGIGVDAEAPPAGAAQELPRVPGYEILAELGRGRWGVVFHARQQQLNRVVALKMILTGTFAGSQELARFDTEASAVARLQHPNIVQIYQKGQHGGLSYLELEYVDGGSLEQRLAGTPQPADAAARLVETLARAVHYAHQCGVVHRDLKPANILLQKSEIRNPKSEKDTEGSDFGFRISAFTPKVADFGLAKLPAGEEGGRTRTGDIAGSPGYMAPEQAAGRTKEAGPAADVYGLGAILYDLLTGRPPFKAETWLETVRQVVVEEPVPPRRLRPRLPRDLETITLRCLQKDPRKRYASALDLADDLRRFLSGESIRARPARAWERGIKWTRRRPTVAALVGVSGLALLGLLGLLTALWHNAEERAGFMLRLTDIQQKLETGEQQLVNLEQDAAAAQQRQQVAQLETRRALYIRDMQLAQLALNRDQPPRLAQLLEAQRPTPGQEDVRGFEWYYLWRLCHGDRLALPGFTAPVREVACDPAGQTIAAVDNDGKFRQWDLATGKEQAGIPGLPAQTYALAFHPGGQLLATGHADGTIKVWQRTTGRLTLDIRGHEGPVMVLVFSPRGRRLASGGKDRTAKLWDMATGAELVRFRRARATIHKIVFAPDGRRLAVTGEEPTGWLWEPATDQGTPLRGSDGAWVQDVAFSPDGKALVTAEAHPFSPTGRGAVRVRDLEAGKDLRRAWVANGGVFAVAFSPDGHTLAWGANSGTLTLYDYQTWRRRDELRGHLVRVVSLAFTPDGQTLASSSGDQTVRLWDLIPKPPRRALPLPGGSVSCVAFAPDGQTLAAAGQNGVIGWWDVATGKEKPAAIEGHRGSIASIGFAPDGRLLASAGEDGTVKLWDPATRRELACLRGHMGPVLCVAFAPDGRTLVSGARDGARLWDVDTKTTRLVLPDQQGPVRAAAFAPDGTTLATVDDTMLRFWDVDTDRPKAVLPTRHQPGLVVTLAFSPDSRHVVTGAWDGLVDLWDVAAARHRTTFMGHTGPALSVAFTPDGRTVASGSQDGTVKLWDLATHLERFTLGGTTDSINRLAFAPNGALLATARSDGTVKLWDASRD